MRYFLQHYATRIKAANTNKVTFTNLNLFNCNFLLA
uniref:Uncharacterized protein n=1 Tax=Setaria italica TaxID=4555 RepID=K3YFA7_SETIT